MAILNRGTLVLVGCAIALGGAVLLLENRSDTAADPTNLETDSELVSEAEDTGELMFPFAEEEIESFTLSRPDETLAFSKDEVGAWQMTAPQTAEAEGGAVAFLLNQLTSSAAQSFDVAPDTLERFGLVAPDVTIELVAAGESYEFLVGDSDFTGDQRYVRAIALAEAENTAAETIDVHLVSGGIANAVERPTEEWLVSEAETSEQTSDGAETTLEEATPTAETVEEDAPQEATEENTEAE